MSQKVASLIEGDSKVTVIAIAVILFAMFSCAGWIYETVENVFSFGGIYLRAAFILPWCPIYGIGGLVIVGVMEPVRRRLRTRVPFVLELIIVAVGIYLLTTAVELAGSYSCEALMGYVPWDYSDAWMNFDGRIAPMYTMRFVVLGLVALYLLYPLVAKWARSHGRSAVIVACGLAAVIAADYVLQSMGVWGPVKDSLVPYGINHW